MKKQLKKWQIFLTIGMGFILLGMNVSRFGIISDLFYGVITGLGIGLAVWALIFAKSQNKCGSQLV